MHCARTFDAPSHFLSTNRNVNESVLVCDVRAIPAHGDET